jgi:hypothetical protein
MENNAGENVMRNLFTTVAAAAMMLGATAANAQNATTEYYVTGEGADMRVMGGDNTEGVVVLGDETYAVPADCPEGSFYRSGENMLTACGEGGASFEIAEPAAGATLRSGDAFPEGAMVMTPRDDGDNAQDASGGTNTGSGGATTGSGSGSTNTGTATGTTGGTSGGTTGGTTGSGTGAGTSDTSTGTGTGTTGGNPPAGPGSTGGTTGGGTTAPQ